MGPPTTLEIRLLHKGKVMGFYFTCIVLFASAMLAPSKFNYPCLMVNRGVSLFSVFFCRKSILSHVRPVQRCLTQRVSGSGLRPYPVFPALNQTFCAGQLELTLWSHFSTSPATSFNLSPALSKKHNSTSPKASQIVLFLLCAKSNSCP
jgi:hypothetical protein